MVVFLVFFVHFQVPVGVIPKNEVKREEMVEIMDELQQKYTPCTGIIFVIIIIRASVDALCWDGTSEISRDPRTSKLGEKA